MSECKTKAIQKNIDTFRHNQTYPGIIQAYPGTFGTLLSPDKLKLYISRTLTHSEPEAYSELRDIHKPGIFRTSVYSERWHIQNLRHIQNPVTHLH